MLKNLAKILSAAAVIATSTPVYADVDVSAHCVTLTDETGVDGYMGFRAGVDMPLPDPNFVAYAHLAILADYKTAEFEADVGLKYSLKLDKVNLGFFAGPGMMFGNKNNMIFRTGIEAKIELDNRTALYVEAAGGMVVWPNPATYTNVSVGIRFPR